jgi:tetratricopeptide (TPR) repeat protein
MVTYFPHWRILSILVALHCTTGCFSLEYDPHRVYRNYSDSGEYELAIDELNRELTSPRRSVPLYILYNDRGELYRWQGQYEKAVADYMRALEVDQTFYITYNNLGLAYTGMKDYEAAISCFNKALELKPGFATSYLNRGLVYLRLNENDKAADDFRKAEALGFKPGKPGARYTS